jgi:hypothetical protein
MRCVAAMEQQSSSSNVYGGLHLLFSFICLLAVACTDS